MTSLLVADSPSLADFPDVKLVTAAADVNESSVFIRLNSDEPQTSPLGNIPVADLTNSPGDTKQRVIDFLVAILDQPCRVSDWK